MVFPQWLVWCGSDYKITSAKVNPKFGAEQKILHRRTACGWTLSDRNSPVIFKRAAEV